MHRGKFVRNRREQQLANDWLKKAIADQEDIPEVFSPGVQKTMHPDTQLTAPPIVRTYVLNMGTATSRPSVTITLNSGQVINVPMPLGYYVTNDGRIKTRGNKRLTKGETGDFVNDLARDY